MVTALICLPWALLLAALTLPSAVLQRRIRPAAVITDAPDRGTPELQPRGEVTGPYGYDNGLMADDTESED